MEIGILDLDTRFEYFIIYERDGKINTWTIGQGGLRVNYPRMKRNGDKFLGIYKKLSDIELLDIITD